MSQQNQQTYLFSEVDPMPTTLSIMYTNEISKTKLGLIHALYIWASTSVGSLPRWLIKLRNTHLNQAASSRKKYTNNKTWTIVYGNRSQQNGGASLRNRGTNSWRVPQCSAVPVVMQWPWLCRCRHDARVPQRPPCGHAPGYAPARCEKNKASTSHLSMSSLFFFKKNCPNKKKI